MKDDMGMSLKDFCAGRTQAQTASMLGVTQGSISQMVNSERDIRVQLLPCGNYRAIELVPIGRRGNSRAEAA